MDRASRRALRIHARRRGLRRRPPEGPELEGQTFGPANGGQESDPALILTIGANGKVAYVKSSELNRKPSRGASKAPRSIAVWDKEANRKIDTFTVG